MSEDERDPGRAPGDGAPAAQPPGDAYPVVAIGGSAGSLVAFQEILRHLTARSGLAVVIVSHQDPSVPSLLAEILANAASLAVVPALDGTVIEPDVVYVAPPGESFDDFELTARFPQLGVRRLLINARQVERGGSEPTRLILLAIEDATTGEELMADPHREETLRESAERLAESAEEAHAEAKGALGEVLHELRVHQIELELQNEELRQTQVRLEESRAAIASSERAYRDLFDNAPLAYLQLDAEGWIRAANRAALALLGAGPAITGRARISDFIDPSSQDAWFLHRRALLAGAQAAPIEIALGATGGAPTVTVELHAKLERAPGSGTDELRIALLDVSARRHAEGDRAKLRLAELRLREAAASAEVASEEQRRALAADLHDDVGQLLSLIEIKLRALLDSDSVDGASRVRELQGLAHQARQHVTSLSFELSPALLFDVGLLAAAERLAEDVEREYGLHMELEAQGEVDALDEVTRIALYRGLRELMINAAKHAGVGVARVAIRVGSETVELDVVDEGKGFDPELATGGFGLVSLRNRIENLGGSLDIVSAIGQPTTCRIILPISRSAGS